MMTNIIIALCSAGLSLLLLTCFGRGMIFSFYGEWLESISNKWYYKPLGGCPDCFTVWVAILVFTVIAITTGVFTIISLILHISLSYYFFRLID
jgi:hypothetical protein